MAGAPGHSTSGDDGTHGSAGGVSRWPGELWHRTNREVRDSEIATINARRTANEAARNKNDPTSVPFDQVPKPQGDELLDVVGLALSGGGIRSAAVCLGVLQALNNYRLLPNIDYMSTVSGGGYIGSAWSAAVAQGEAKFPFGDLAPDKPRQELAKDKPTADEVSDTASVAHIRNYSNFIIPQGFRDVLTGIAIVVRGLIVNVAIVLPFILAVAAVTIVSNPTRSLLTVTDVFGFATATTKWWQFLAGFAVLGAVVGMTLPFAVSQKGQRLEFGGYLFGIGLWLGLIFAFATLLSVENFGITLADILMTMMAFAFWGLWRSLKRDGSEFRGYAATAGAIALVLIVVIAFFEAQPFVLDAMFRAYDVDPETDAFSGAVAGWIKWLTTASASATVFVTFFRDKLAGILKSDASSSIGAIVKVVGAKAAIWLGSLALPLLIWIGFLHLSLWGIVNDQALPTCPPPVQQSCPAVAPESAAATCARTGASKPAAPAHCKVRSPDLTDVEKKVEHVPTWLNQMAEPFRFDWSSSAVPAAQPSAGTTKKKSEARTPGLKQRFAGGVISIYVILAIVLLIASLGFEPNANSLHRLYRDRLGKAFLFQPRPKGQWNSRTDFPENDTLALTRLSPTAAPYQLIGAALNIQGSPFANRRGRNADFFLFSRNKVGSEATDYVDTERYGSDLDLATVIAISGAAASSNMGANSIRPLTPTLALLNIRLGYWLKNPRAFTASAAENTSRSLTRDKKPALRHSSLIYLFQELSGRLYDDADSVYLTDGGHIENLGIYELLRRRCKVIIAVDAEADPEMHFPSFVTLQRYARIDLGILIDLPWQRIRDRTLAIMKENEQEQPKDCAASGPHVAIGTINYGGGAVGHLVYIKSSLSGDENDYVRDYARRFSTFPHESTIEQFFSEEQFEVYRALGFHMTHGWLKAESPDDIVVKDRDEKCALRKFGADIDALKDIRKALRWPPNDDVTPPVPS